MAGNTDPMLQNQVIYSVYVRNHTPEGTFRALIPDLPRIRALGTDILWLAESRSPILQRLLPQTWDVCVPGYRRL